ncbi:MAG TPA: FAD-dependent monooxygenase [Friedmanniella sp.]
MKYTSVLISGASIAGPALAYWLARYGFDVTVVEKASGLRPGGQAVDFKGETHLTVLRRMGILDEIRAAQTSGDDGVVVDAAGRTLAIVPREFSGGELEIARGDLARLLLDRTSATTEYVFGDSISTLTETGPERAARLAQTLISTSIGVKHQAGSRRDYRERMAVAVDLLLR